MHPNSFKNVTTAGRTGSLILQGAVTTIAVDIVNDGGLLIDGKTLVLEKGAITQGASGVISFGNGTIIVPNGPFILDGGLMEGYGTVQGDFNFLSGTIQFAGATTLAVTGSFTQSRDAVLDYHFVNRWGLMTVGRTASLSGKYRFTEEVGTPAQGQWCDFLTTGMGTVPGPEGPMTIDSPTYTLDLLFNKLRAHN